MVPVLGKSQRTRIEFNGDETFTYFQRPAEDAIFNGELFKEKERQFLKRNMRLHNVSFPIGHQQTVQIELKSFWQKESMNLNRRGLREGRFVTLLSDQRPPIEDALAWVKCFGPSSRAPSTRKIPEVLNDSGWTPGSPPDVPGGSSPKGCALGSWAKTWSPW
eukprot:g16367.t1